MREGVFTVCAVSTVDAALELLSGRPAGARGPDGRFPEESFNGAVDRALAQNVERLRLTRPEGFAVSSRAGGAT